VALAARGRDVVLAKVGARVDLAAESELLIEQAILVVPQIHDCAGAPLVDGQGTLVGVGALPLQRFAAAAPDARGTVFIPVERFQPLLAHAARAGGARAPRKPWLGLVTRRSGGALVVADVPPDSPAGRAGLLVGDVIVAVDGTPVGTQVELYRLIWRAGAPGADVRLAVRRDGAAHELRVRTIDPQDYFIHRA
jgi:S1-C subfamily serine protease